MALALDESKDSDHVIDIDGITYLLDKDLAETVGKVTVDYTERGFRTGFVISTKKPVGWDISNCGSSCAC